MSVGAIAIAGCGDDGGSDSGGTETSAGGTTTGDGTTGGMPPSTGVDDGDGSGGSSGSGPDASGSSDATGSSGSVDETTAGADETTAGIDVEGFESFLIEGAAGPCGPRTDCDGFLELLADGTLRVEVFGDVTKAVTEVAITKEDFDAAVLVFADPALVALLDGNDPVCKPPTDIFEQMTVVIDGVTHDAATTACDDAPLVAARAMADSLQTEYVP